MVVAGPRGAEPVRRVRLERRGPAGEHAQRFERGGDAGPFQTVVPMPALGGHLHEALRSQPLQVDAGGRRGDARDDGELGARPGAAVEQAIEHPGARRLADGGGDGGDGGVGLCGSHSSILDEV